MIKRIMAVAIIVGASLMVSLPAQAQIYVRIAPPAPMVETMPAPRPGYVWQGGYWRWDGSRYVWVHGAYGRPGTGHAHWCPGHWHNGAKGYWWVEGKWC